MAGYELDVFLEVGEADWLTGEPVQVGEDEGREGGQLPLPLPHPGTEVYLSQPGAAQPGVPGISN